MPSSARSMPPFLSIAFGYAGSKEICLSLPRENVNLGIHDEWRKIKTCSLWRWCYPDWALFVLFFFSFFSFSSHIHFIFLSSFFFFNFFLDLARLFMFAIVFVAVLYSVLVNNYSLCFDQLSHRDFPLWFPLPYSFLLLILRLFLLSFM